MGQCHVVKVPELRSMARKVARIWCGVDFPVESTLFEEDARIRWKVLQYYSTVVYSFSRIDV